MLKLDKRLQGDDNKGKKDLNLGSSENWPFFISKTTESNTSTENIAVNQKMLVIDHLKSMTGIFLGETELVSTYYDLLHSIRM